MTVRTNWARGWSIVGVVGLVASALIAIAGGVRANATPMNTSPYDSYWALVYGGAFVLIGGLGWFQRGRWLVVATGLALAVFTGITVARAGTGPALMGLAWIMIASFGAGDRLLNSLTPSLKNVTIERVLLATITGLGALALVILGVGLLNLLYGWMPYALLGFMTLVGLPSWANLSRALIRREIPLALARWQTGDAFAAVALGCLGVCAWGGLVWAIAPSTHFDALVYHLGVPAIYVQQHGIVPVVEEFRSYWAHNAEMLYALGLLLTGQPLPAFMHFTFGLIVAGLTYAFGRKIGGSRLGVLAALLVYSLPIVTWESGTALIDLLVASFALGSCYAGLAWWLDDNDDWLTIVGIMAALAMGTKLNAVLVLLPLAAFLLAGLVHRRRPTRRFWFGLARAGLPALLLYAPWLCRDWWWTGNPVFPYYNAIFASPKWPLSNTFFNFGDFGVGHTWADFLRLPFDMVWRADSFGEACPTAIAGGLCLLGLPWMYLGGDVRKRRLAAILAAFVVLALAIWFSIGQFMRYLLPVLPLLAVLAAQNIELIASGLAASRWKSVWVALGLVLALSYILSTRLVATVWGWGIPERVPYEVALGAETPSHFLSRAVPVYDAYQYLDQIGDGKHNVLSVGSEFRVYTTSRIWGVHGSTEAGNSAAALPPGVDLANSLKRRGYDYLLVNRTEIRANPRQYSLPVLDPGFLDQFTQLEYSQRNVYVYRLSDGGQPVAATSGNLIWNGGFEDPGSDGSPLGWFVYGAAVIDHTPARAHTGEVSVRAGPSEGLFQRVQTEPGRLYTLSHWTRADIPQQFARLQINWLDDSLKIIDVSIDVVPVGAEWQRHQMTVTAPKGSTTAQVYASVHEASQVWFDDVEFVQGEGR